MPTIQRQQYHHKIVVPKMRHLCTLSKKRLKKESVLPHNSAGYCHLCQSSYISKEVLSDRILNAHLPTIIVDVRDDAIGGMVQGALFCPERTFSRRKMMCLLDKVKEKRHEHNSGITDHKAWVVFYSQETQTRSVKCAQNFYALVSELGQQKFISVKLLTGGADGWIRSHRNDKRLVEGYDDQYWGFDEDIHSDKQIVK